MAAEELELAMQPATASSDPIQNANESLVGIDDGNQWAIQSACRFFLALVVVMCHVRILAPEGGGQIVRDYGGRTAVSAFFMISGYAIAASVERESRHFYIRRFIRLYPIYLLGLGIAYIADRMAIAHIGDTSSFYLSHPATPTGWIAGIFLLQQFAAGSIIVYAQAWSLAFEAFYYCFAPLLNRLTDRKLITVFAGSFLLFMIVPGSAKSEGFQLFPGFCFFVSAWAWLAGFLAYRLRTKNWLALSASYLFALTLGFNAGGGYPEYLIVGTALAICLGRNVPLSKDMRRIFLWLGGH